MTKANSLIGKTVTLKPTSGGHQKPTQGEIIAETPTRITVRIAGRFESRTFVKSTGEPYAKRDREFPRFVVDLASIIDPKATTPDHIMRVLRQRAELEPGDTSKDAALHALPPLLKLRHVAAWELGSTDWADQFITWMKDCGIQITDPRD